MLQKYNSKNGNTKNNMVLISDGSSEHVAQV